MRIPRIYEPEFNINQGNNYALSENGYGHIFRVLRMSVGEQIIIFNGDGIDHLATIIESNKKNLIVNITKQIKVENESPLYIHLGQVVSRGDKMEFTIQKAVELGVKEITPLISSRCGVKLSNERLDKKNNQWQKIIESACEQSGRSIIPKLNPTISLEEFIKEKTEDLCLNLHPNANNSIKTIPIKKEQKIRFIIGSEGGLSDEEIDIAKSHGYIDIILGPRILRTETAALTTLSALQCYYGDLA